MLASASKYALKIVIYLAKNKENGKIGGKRIAEDLGLAAPFVGKVLQPLAQSGIVKSTKGPHGGFILASEPEAIPLLDVIKIYEGKDAFKQCILNSCNCNTYIQKNGNPCRVHDEISPAREQLLESLNSKTIADFLYNENKISQETLTSIFQE